MTSIIRETAIATTPDTAWDALRDFGALHDLASGFVTSTKLEDDRTRIVTFFNGATVREVLIGIDEQARRIAWTITDLPGATHHSGSAQILADGGNPGRCRFLWTTDVLPDELAERLATMMEAGLAAMKRTLESGD
jgi:Polyketide cyclase / dehydrase and lipid transport